MIVYHSIEVTVGSDGPSPIYFDSVGGIRVALESFNAAGRGRNMERQTW